MRRNVSVQAVEVRSGSRSGSGSGSSVSSGAATGIARRALLATALTAAGALALSGCAAAGNADEGAGSGDLSKVSFALDWAPNTNHIGVFVADELGYFEDAGLEVEILPYGSTGSTALVSAGEADFGIGGQSGVQVARTAGLDLVSVYRVTQSDTGRLVVMGDRDDIERPKDLDGKVYGGFGSPLLSAYAKTVIEGDGGAGEFEEVSLDTGAYEALSQGRIDFTLSVVTWEDVEMRLDGHPYKAFRYQDFGLPEQQSTGIVSSDAYLEAHPDEARAFVEAVARGYEYAAKNPEKAADLLIQANPDELGAAKELVHESAKLMAEDGYLVSPERPIGAVDEDAWAEFGRFLFEQKLLVDKSGKPVSQEPDWSEYYTNEYTQGANGVRS